MDRFSTFYVLYASHCPSKQFVFKAIENKKNNQLLAEIEKTSTYVSNNPFQQILGMSNIVEH